MYEQGACLVAESREEIISLGFEETFRKIIGLSLGQVRQREQTDRIDGDI